MKSHPPEAFSDSSFMDPKLMSGAEPSDPELALEQTLTDPGFVQHVIRRREEGFESYVGYFRCHLTSGQQRFVMHVPFSPAMNHVPEVEAMVVDEMESRIRITDCQKFGIRLELILPSPVAADTDFVVEVIANSKLD